MLCFIHKWNISRAFDSGKPLAGLTNRHLARCETCREFCRHGEEIGRRLTKDAASLLSDARPGLDERVRRVVREPALASIPYASQPRRLWMRPVLAAAVALAFVGISFFWIARPRQAGMPRLDPLLNLETQRANLVSAMQRAESPYQEEILKLKKTFKSTAEYLAARFDTGLGDNN
jgi:hypothetical protein